jgi:hypothetical protein
LSRFEQFLIIWRALNSPASHIYSAFSKIGRPLETTERYGIGRAF